MKPKYSVKLKDIVKEQELTVVHASKDFSEARIYTADVNRPALQLTGFYNYFDPKICTFNTSLSAYRLWDVLKVHIWKAFRIASAFTPWRNSCGST